MNFTANKKNLSECVLNIQRAVSAKSAVPALQGILITSENQSITLSSYDLELGMTTTLPAQIQEPGRTVLSAHLLGDIVRKSPSDEVSFSVDEKNIAVITSGASQFSIIGIDAAEFPEFPSVSDTQSFSISQSVLKSMIKQTIFAVSDNDSKPVHTGILFEANNQRLCLVAVDGYRMAIRTENINFNGTLSFVVPGKTLSEVLKLLSDSDENVDIFIGRRHILFKIGNYTVLSTLLEGEFLNYRSAIPSTYATEMTVKTRLFQESIERVSLLITDRLKSPVRSLFENGDVKNSCSTAMGRASDQISCEMTGERVEIGFNNQYLLDALRNVDTDEVKIGLNGALSPMILKPVSGDSFLFLVLPVRLKNE